MNIESLLPRVEKPARYIGGEIHSARKDPSTIEVRFALAFPDVYEIGASNLGLSILYSILNATPGVQAERVYAPWKDMEARMREAGLPLCSLETRTPLREFDAVGFSLAYELAATNVLQMLDLAGIPLTAEERTGRDPIVLAGGPCTTNPAPFAAFFDALVIGDGERAAPEIARALAAHKRSGGDRRSALGLLAEIEGVYVPSLPGAKARRAIVGDLAELPLTCRVPIPWIRPVHDRVAIEVARGCTAGCRFCQAGMIYRPVRERRPEALVEWAERALLESGSDVVGLLSLSTGDYSSVCSLATELARRFGARGVSLALPSLRIGSVRPELVASLARAGRRAGFTIAPEAGSERLRDVINKPMSDETIIRTARAVLEAGWSSVKLYFMIGLPGEEDGDIQGIVEMARALASIARRAGGDRRVVVHPSTFVPKAHTPFQWEGQIPLDRIREILGRLKSDVRGRALELRWHDPRLSRLEAVIARGDPSVAGVIREAYRRGARFDAWAESLDERAWEEAFSATGLDPAALAGRSLGPEEPLPWDSIDTRIERGFLEREHARALRGERLGDCRRGGCPGACGTCDFDRVRNVVHEPVDLVTLAAPDPGTTPARPAPAGAARYRIWYRKTGDLRFLGHLDLAAALSRAVRRARLPLRLSEGFHPLPRLRFGPALAVGIESLCEFMDLDLTEDLPSQTILDRLGACLPADLGAERVERIEARSRGPEGSNHAARYRVRIQAEGNGRHGTDPFPDLEAPIARALDTPELPLAREGKPPLDLRPFLAQVRVTAPGEIEVVLRTIDGRSPRPIDAIEAILELPAGSGSSWRVVKIATETAA